MHSHRAGPVAPAGAAPSQARGQSLVELALILPVLLLLLLAGIDFGRVYLGYVNLQSLARIAANYAANNPTITWSSDTDLKVLAYNRIIGADATTTNCIMQADASHHNPPRPTFSGTDLGDTARVQLTCNFELITPIIKNVFGGGTIAVSASAQFPVKSGGVAGIGVGQGGSNVPFANFSGSPTSGAEPLTVAFTDLSTNAPTGWQWNFGDNGGSNSQNPSHQYLTAGTYTVSLTATNAAGFTTTTKPGYIVVGTPGVANFSATPTSGAAPLTVAFTDQSTGSPDTWTWTFGDGGISSAQNPSHTYASAGTYSVTLTVNGPGGSDSQTKTGYIVVGARQCSVPDVSDASTMKVQATNQLQSLGFVVVKVGDNSNWLVREQSPAGGSVVDCGSTVTIYQ